MNFSDVCHFNHDGENCFYKKLKSMKREKKSKPKQVSGDNII